MVLLAIALLLCFIPLVEAQGATLPPTPPTDGGGTESTASPVSAPEPDTTTPAPADAGGAPTETTTPAPPSGAWSGCIDPNGDAKPVDIGETTTVCLHAANNVDWTSGAQYIRMTFQPQADKFSRLHIPDCKFHFKSLVLGFPFATILS
jgi:hypothetical protein